MEIHVTASQFQQSFGALSDKARFGPVVITKHGRPSLVMMAAEEWERLKLSKAQVQIASLDPQTLAVAKAFLKHIAPNYALKEVLLFGSRARNTHRPESDLDLAVVLNGNKGDRGAAVKDLAAVAFHVMMETGVMVDALPIWAEELSVPEAFSNPALLQNILREGIRL
jgi:uncharacterized protein